MTKLFIADRHTGHSGELRTGASPCPQEWKIPRLPMALAITSLSETTT